jgi:hypothetical protein
MGLNGATTGLGPPDLDEADGIRRHREDREDTQGGAARLVAVVSASSLGASIILLNDLA